MRAKFGVGLYALGALWLAAFVAYLVYLLLPFEYLALGLFEISPPVIIGSALLAALVAFALLVWLGVRLLRPAWRGEAISGRRFGIVVALTAATLVLDAGWTHYLVPFPPTDQDDCSFDAIGPEEFGALKREMAAKLDLDWASLLQDRNAEEVPTQIKSALPEVAAEAVMLAHIHALARAIGAEFDGGGTYRKEVASYGYRFDANKLLIVRSALFRWGVLNFSVKQLGAENGEISLERVSVLLPGLKGPDQYPPRSRSCPRLSNPTQASAQPSRSSEK